MSRKSEAREFKRWIFKDVIPTIRKTGSYTMPGAQPQQPLALPGPGLHTLRLIANSPQVPTGHFSVLDEIAGPLLMKLEVAGYRFADNLSPDGAVGSAWALYLRQGGEDVDSFPTFDAVRPDGSPIRADYAPRAYPYRLLHEFHSWLRAFWIPARLKKYIAMVDEPNAGIVEASGILAASDG